MSDTTNAREITPAQRSGLEAAVWFALATQIELNDSLRVIEESMGGQDRVGLDELIRSAAGGLRDYDEITKELARTVTDRALTLKVDGAEVKP